MRTACFTGHRPHKLGNYNENHPIALDVKSRLERVVKHLISEGYTTFISGVAIGVDTWGAQIVLRERDNNPDIKLICAVPFLGQESRWNNQAQELYRTILSQADKVEIVSEGGYSAYKMQIRNEYMVNNSDCVIAVWDGTSGGTANCVRYAQKAQHKPMIIRIQPINTN